MFKNLFEFVDAEYDEPTSDFEKKFFAEIKKFAFYDALDKACKKTKGKNIDCSTRTVLTTDNFRRDSSCSTLTMTARALRSRNIW